jgi:hypothetical protein
MPNVPSRRGLPAREASAWPLIGRIVLAGLGGATAAAVGPLRPAAQQAEPPPSVRVAPTIVAAANSEAVLAIEVQSLDTTPSRGFVSLRGLPPTVALRDGHAVGPGSWAVPLSALPFVKAQIPATQAGESEIVVSLIAMDGRLLAQARSTLVIQSSAQAGPGIASQAAPAPTAGQLASAAPAPAMPESAAEQRARAERLLARGEAYLANGNIMGARDFFERAADAGLAAGALQLASTYDRVELTRLKVQGVKPDVELARKWYQRARDLGATGAAELLMRLGRN